MDEKLREYHEVSMIFPMMEEAEYQSLRDDIKKNGLLEPIWIDTDGKIIDGRNRHKACIETNEPIKFDTVNGNVNLLDFVISKNIHRRHLTTGQRSVIAEELANMPNHRPYKSANLPTYVSQPEAAKKMNVGERSIRDVKEIKTEMPELIDDIKAGKLTINEAKKQVKEKRHADKIAKQQEKIKDIEISRLIINNDFRLADIPKESVDLIITDPPYGRDFAETWSGLSTFANRVLKPSAFLISYFGQLNMPDFINSLSKELIYYWTFSLQHTGNNQLIMPRNIFCGWKPIFIFQKQPFKKLERPIEDVIIGSGREKDDHKWQQAEAELNYLIDRFSEIGALIVDPFCGSGTTLVAALKKNRNVIGIEIDETYCKIATERLNGIQN